MKKQTERCEFCDINGEDLCGAPAEHKIIWYLWPLAKDDVDEHGETIPRWARLCKEHFEQLQRFHTQYPPTHDKPDENEPSYSSVVPIGISISDVTVGYRLDTALDIDRNPSGSGGQL